MVDRCICIATTPLTTAKTSLQLAHEMVESYLFDEKTGVSTFTVPAGLTDVEAMKAWSSPIFIESVSFNF